MGKIRVHELAKELGLNSKDMVNKLRELGIEVKNHFSTLEEGQVARIKGLLSREEKARSPEAKAEDASKPAPAPPVPAARDEKEGRPAPETRTQQRSEPAAARPPQPPAATRPGEQRQHRPRPQGGTFISRPPVRPGEQYDRMPPLTPAGAGRPGEARPAERAMRGPGAAPGYPARPAGARPDEPFRSGQRPEGVRPPQPMGRPGGPRPGGQQPMGQRPMARPEPRPVGPRPAGPQPAGPQRPMGQRPMGPRPGGAVPGGRPAGGRGDVIPGRPGEKPRPAAGFAPRTAERPADKAAVKPPEKVERSRFPEKKTDKPDRLGGRPGAKPALKKLAEPGRAPGRLVMILDEDEPAVSKLPKKKSRAAGKGQRAVASRPPAPTLPEAVTLGRSVAVQELAAVLKLSPVELVKRLMNLGVMVTINQEIDFDTAALLCTDLGVEVNAEKTAEEALLPEVVDDPESLRERPPVVTVMGHVDHGKTSLLDAIRRTKVTETEAGGITQHIGAYQVEVRGRKITFIDTPGHEAFTAMRARGAQVTDIAVLVVAADDGVMPQTVEAINHARAAGVPIIVAINKIDKPEANPERIKQQLTEHGLLAEDWGGDTIFVPVSAITRQGLDTLLEMILLVAEVSDLKANPDRLAKGTVVEAKLDKGRGPVATVLVQSGTLRVGDSFLVGLTSGKVRAMVDDNGQWIREAYPSMPVEVLGLNDVPMAGDVLQVVAEDRVARQITESRQTIKRAEEMQKTSRVTLDDLFHQIQEGKVKELNLIIKADVQGSIEALRQSLEKLSTSEVRINVVHSGVGTITESDVMLAAASNAIIIGFNVRPDTNTRRAAEAEEVDIRLYRVIYEAIDDIRSAMSGLLEPEWREVVLGRAEVRATFKVPKVGNVAGCYVLDGKIVKGSDVRVIRNGIVIQDSKIDSLRRFKDDVREVVQGFECGLGIERFNDIKEGDILEAYTREKVERTL